MKDTKTTGSSAKATTSNARPSAAKVQLKSELGEMSAKAQQARVEPKRPVQAKAAPRPAQVQAKAVPTSAPAPQVSTTASPQPIQMAAQGGMTSGNVHQAAQEGTQGTGHAIPFGDQIQHSFGKHGASPPCPRTSATGCA